MINVKTPEDATDALLRIDKLTLENYRCFSECSLDFHPSLTVLVAENAQGKSTILEALSLALDPLVATLTESKSPGFARSDVRLTLADVETMTPILPASFAVEGEISGRPVSWSRSLGSVSAQSRSSKKELKTVVDAAVATGQAIAHNVNGRRACPIHKVAVKLAARACCSYCAFVGLPIKVVAIGSVAQNRPVAGLWVKITNIFLIHVKGVAIRLSHGWKLNRQCNR